MFSMTGKRSTVPPAFWLIVDLQPSAQTTPNANAIPNSFFIPASPDRSAGATRPFVGIDRRGIATSRFPFTKMRTLGKNADGGKRMALGEPRGVSPTWTPGTTSGLRRLRLDARLDERRL